MAAGRLTKILNTNGYSHVAPLLSGYKDWNEDIKAKHGLPAVPAEEHPQIAICKDVCNRIADLCRRLPHTLRPEQKLPALLQQYKKHLYWRSFERAHEYLEELAAVSLTAAQKEHNQMGTQYTAEQMADMLKTRFSPHQNHGRVNSRTESLSTQIHAILRQSSEIGIRSKDMKEKLADSYMELALSSAMIIIRVEADKQKQEMKRSESVIRMQ